MKKLFIIACFCLFAASLYADAKLFGASEFGAERSKNAKSFDKKYKNKMVSVVGKIVQIKKADNDQGVYIVRLLDSANFSTIDFYFSTPEAINNLETGDSVTITGVYRNVNGAGVPLIFNSFAEKSKSQDKKTASLEDKDDYQKKVMRKIVNEWVKNTEQKGLQNRERHYETVVHFVISKDGYIVNDSVEVIKSSGNEAFDALALEVTGKVKNFAPLPEIYTEDSLGINFIFKD